MATQRNYAQQMDAVLATLGNTRPRLLLHACCGPCSSAVLEQLCRYFEITVLYYNPNTWPAAEYYRRGEELQKFVAAAHPLGVTVVEDTYDPQQFYTAVAGLENEPERGSRCTVCYRLRMRRAAQYARDKGACVLVKGLRNATDFDQEYQMASINRGILPGLETVFLPASPAYQHFSSTMVREMLRYGQPMEQYVPAPVAAQWKGRS